jgi:Zn finger protein HypA/HybF involved in hydrogenase expression
MSKKNCKISDEEFIEIVKNSYSIRACLEAQGLVAAGGSYKAFHKRVKGLGLDTSHFTGQGHLKGKTHNWKPETSIEDAFIIGGNLSSFSLNKKIRKYNLKEYKCSECGIFEWLGKELSLHIDHINGINNDNRLENLRFLCPNCHSQTDTYCGKNLKSKETPLKPIKIPRERIPREIRGRTIYRDLCGCGQIKLSSSKKCSTCNNTSEKPLIRKVDRPSKEELLELLWSQSTLSLGKVYGVSDNAIRKWAKTYGIPFPPRGYWAKFAAGNFEECEVIKNQMIQK